MHRIASLDLLRGLAAFFVAIPHFILLGKESHGAAEVVSVLAVEVFFVLSGFVLGDQILRCFHTGRPGDLGILLTRRWMRTIPPYLFALALISTIMAPIGWADFVRYSLYLQNVYAQHNTNDYFPVAWSLSIEEWFYVVFLPLVMGASFMFHDKRDRFAVIVALLFIVTITVLRLSFGSHNQWGAEVRRVVIFRIDSIAYGFLLYMFVRQFITSASTLPPAVLRPPVALGLLALMATLAGAMTWNIMASQSAWSETLFPFAAAGFGAASILAALAVRNPLQSKRWISESCYFMGRVSYSVYLFHLSIAVLAAPYLAALPVFLQLSVYVAICIGVSAIFYNVFEGPILAMRPGYRPLDGAASTKEASLTAR